MGVLQRIALAWGLGAIVVLLVRRNYIWISTLVILLGYWALMYFFGGSDPYSLEGNFARQVDITILGENHLYKGFGVPFDPEGLLSTLPAIGTVLLGFMAGNLISSFGTSWKTAGWLTLIGAALIGAGLLWGQFFPINKPIWTSSYVLYAGGIGMVILALMFILVDIWGLKGWTGFFNTFGTNALFTYVLAGIWTKTMLAVKIGDSTLYNWIFTHICSPLFEEQKIASLMFAIMQVLIIWAFGYILYRKKIIIRL
jgi:predicted acyltransferase